jgi:hypothetical protein
LECVTLTPSGAGVLIAILTPGTGAGPGRVDFPFGMTPEVFLLELRGAVTVFTQRIRCAVQEGAVAGRVEVLQLAEQVCLCKILGGHTWHVVLLWPVTCETYRAARACASSGAPTEAVRGRMTASGRHR